MQKCYLLHDAPRFPTGKSSLLRDLCQDLRIDSICAVNLIDSLRLKADYKEEAAADQDLVEGGRVARKRRRGFVGGSGQMLTLLASNDLDLFSTAGLSKRRNKVRTDIQTWIAK